MKGTRFKKSRMILCGVFVLSPSPNYVGGRAKPGAYNTFNVKIYICLCRNEYIGISDMFDVRERDEYLSLPTLTSGVEVVGGGYIYNYDKNMRCYEINVEILWKLEIVVFVFP